MRDPDDARWVRGLATLLRADHRQEIVDDLLEERRARVARGEPRAAAALWLVSHLLRSAVAGWSARANDREPTTGVRGVGRQIGRDARYATRRLLARPGLMAAAVLTLTLGIGLSAGLFGVVNALAFKTPPVANLDRVITVHPANQPASAAQGVEFDSFDAMTNLERDAIDDLSAATPWFGVVRSPAGAQQLSAELVSARYFHALGLAARVGTLDLFVDDRSPRQAVVISDRLWHRWFHGDTSAVGQTMIIAGDPLVIVGVAPVDFGGIFEPALMQVDLWLPFDVTPHIDQRRHRLTAIPQLGMSSNRVRVLGRLRADQTLAAAAGTFAAIGGRLAPETFSGLSTLTVSPLRESFTPYDLQTLAARLGGMFGALASLVLLIACSNLANLLLADVLGRTSEFAVRLTSGATRAHLVRSVLAETLMLTLLGWAGGLVLAVEVARTLAAIVVGLTFGASVTLDASPDWRVVAFSGLIALVTAVGIGAGPAWRAARTTPATLLSRGFGGLVESRRKQVLFVAAQVGACTVLLIVASLHVRSALALYGHDPGFDGSRIARVGVDLRLAGHDQSRSRELLGDMLDRMRALPQVRRAFLTMNYPQRLTGQPTALIADVGVADHQPRTSGYFARVSTDFFDALHLPIVAGRSFLPSDGPNAPRVAIVNESAAALWPDGRALGGRLALSNSDGAWLEVVGIARDSDVETPGRHGPLAFVPLEQAPYTRVSVMVETADARPDSLLGAMRDVVTGIDPDAVIVDSSTVATDQAQLTLPIRLAAAALAGVGGVGLVIALLGLYAITARAVKTRTREIGVRMALGADAGAIQAMVLRHSMMMVAGGLVPGLLLAFIANGVLRSALYGIGPLDPLTFAGVPACLIAAGLLATLRPARRASRVDPKVALREL